MAFNPQDVDNAIRAAGSQLQEMWKRPGQMPENNLHPDASALAFRLKLLEDKYSTLETVVGQLVRAINGRK